MRTIRVVSFVAALVVALMPSPSFGASFSFSPDSGSLTTGCSETIDIRIDSAGSDTNGAQVYLDHDGEAGEVTLLATGDFSTYTVPDENPTSYDLLVGYGSYLNSATIRFARVRLNSTRIGATINLSVYYDSEDPYSSQIALDGTDITTGAGSASFTVTDGFCETAPPYLQNLDPEPNEPAHPVSGDIVFDLKDNSSGVDIETLEVDVIQDGEPIRYEYDDERLTYTAINERDYTITIDPLEDFISELVVTVDVTAADRAGNVMNRIYSFNDLTCEELGCSGSLLITQCNDGIDNDGDGDIDSGDSGCTDITDNNEYVIPLAHGCNDGIDNDGDGDIDLDDANCKSESSSGGGTVTEYVTSTITTTIFSTNTVTTGGGEVDIPDCRDGRDNDGDGLVDFPADDGCEDEDDVDEYTPLPDGAISPDDLLYFLADRTIQVFASEARVVDGLVQNDFSVDLRIDDIEKTIGEVSLHMPFGIYPMFFDNTNGRYRADLTLPTTAGFADAFVRVTYSDAQIESVPFRLQMLPYGQVVTYGDASDIESIDGATVALEWYNGGVYNLVSKVPASGARYAFVVPNGTYRLVTQADGYRAETSARFTVSNAIVNRTITLLPEISLLDPEVPLDEKVDFTVDVVQEQVENVAELINDPVVEEQSERRVAPVAAVVTSAALVPALTALGFLNYLRYLFLQPLLLLGRRKRKGWGYVYDTLTRNPIDLALVRLLDNKTNRVVQSRVTDTNGRYIFFADPGVYRIEVVKDHFEFPTTLLTGEQVDGPYLDIYHGEPIRVEEGNTAIAANIPIDPVAAEKAPSRIKFEKFFRQVQRALAGIGILAGIIAAIITPTILTIGLLLLQIVVLVVFYRISKPQKPKNWGIVYDATNKKRLPQVVVRLFSKRFNKLVSTDYTDTKGRYAFLVNPNEYYVTYEKRGYDEERKDVHIKRDTDVISENIGMNPKDTK